MPKSKTTTPSVTEPVAKKKRGRPSKTDVVVRDLTKNLLALGKVNEQLKLEVDSLVHEITGYKAVVSYLEFHCGLKDSQ